ncbi:superoxide dismutase [Cu-Zn]-like [Physella acuta]|uniref:superoxide dismutase [Cu-Zn]-like n=1 Tax=Physella acuta TaxID=109671 RepID=UPI0027DB96F4|nr:superoxide dismutase [Cu-Zn]-like [Physella acuta]
MSSIFYLLAGLALAHAWRGSHNSGPRKAVCVVQPDPQSTQLVTGIVNFTQSSYRSALKIDVKLQGFSAVPESAPESQFLHGFHIHEFGDLSGGCTSAGGHYNPFNVTHGDINDGVRHTGDLGNIRQRPDGTIPQLRIKDRRASLYGEFSILGRAVVVHAKADDLGRGGNPASLLNGNAGSRLACCVIGLANPV